VKNEKCYNGSGEYEEVTSKIVNQCSLFLNQKNQLWYQDKEYSINPNDFTFSTNNK